VARIETHCPLPGALSISSHQLFYDRQSLIGTANLDFAQNRIAAEFFAVEARAANWFRPTVDRKKGNLVVIIE
jgi:hypothetical protein